MVKVSVSENVKGFVNHSYISSLSEGMENVLVLREKENPWRCLIQASPAHTPSVIYQAWVTEGISAEDVIWKEV